MLFLSQYLTLIYFDMHAQQRVKYEMLCEEDHSSKVVVAGWYYYPI